MKRLICGCAALVLFAALILPISAHAGWAEGLLLQEPNDLQEAVLPPGSAGVYPLAVLVDGNPAPLTDAVLGGGSLSLAVEEGEDHLALARLKKENGVHCLELQTAAFHDVPAAPVRLTLSRREGGQTLASCRVEFQVGWPTAENQLLQQLQPGQDIPVDPAAPAFTAAQMADLMEKNSGSLTFAGEGWRYEVTPDTAQNLCLLFSSDPIPAVAQQLEQEGRLLRFFGFPAAAAPGRGQLTLDVSSLQAEQLYVYRYAYGRLYRFPARYDAAAGSLTFSTGVLGRFVVTDLPVAEGTVIGGAGEAHGGTGSQHTEKNPNTGDPTLLVPVGILAAAAGAGAVWMSKNHEKTKRGEKK